MPPSDPFADTPSADTLLRKTAAGVGWIIGWRLTTRLLGLVSTLVLVRLLLPADFGLVALATSFAQAIEGFSWLGVEESVIREKHPSRDIYDTGFTLNVLRSMLTGAVILAAARPAAAFFSDPRMSAVLAVLAFSSLLDGFENIGVVDFRRDFAFDKEFRLWIFPRILGIVCTLAVAFASHSYWALIGGILARRAIRVALSYRMHPYRPRLAIRAWHSLIGYSLWTWVLGIAVLLRDRSDMLLIGRLLTPGAVGLYSVGAEVAALPTTELVEPLCRAAFSGFAAGRNAQATPGETYRRMIATTALLTLPAGIGISLVAGPLVQLALGPRWIAAIPVLQILAPAGGITVFGYVSSTLLRAHGLMRDTLGITLAALAVRVGLLVLLTTRYGLPGAAAAAAGAIVLEQVLYIAIACRRFAIAKADVLRSVGRSLLATAVMAGVLARLGFGWHEVAGPPTLSLPILQLIEGVAVGAAVYAAVLLAAWLAAGRPAGAETDFLDMLRWLARRLRRAG
jgi:lipopolysaccharide exporter